MKLLLPLLLALSGCGTVQVADQCYFLTPNQVESFIIVLEGDIDRGITKREQLDALAYECGGNLDCLSCGTSLINAVYGG